jgi:UDP-GlcNAc3NAcA epimerase
MSEVFFAEMQIPKPDYNLGTGSMSHGKQTADMIEKIEEILINEKPDFAVLYGDTNSTLAGSVAAAKVNIPIVHIEAGLRSFNKSMPEEINRIVCDHTSTLLFSPTRTGINNLIREGFNAHAKPPFTPDNPGIFHCGDIMYDNSLYFAKIAEKKSGILATYHLQKGNFILGTIHRDNNTDNPERLSAIFGALNEIARENESDIVLPLHPRTSKVLKQNLGVELFESVTNNQFIKIIPPASFFEIIVLEKNCNLVMTDSGGVQKEAYYFEKPVIILRPETEWVEIVENGCGKVTDANKENILEAYQYFKENENLDYPSVFGDGKAAEFIWGKLI